VDIFNIHTRIFPPLINASFDIIILYSWTVTCKYKEPVIIQTIGTSIQRNHISAKYTRQEIRGFILFELLKDNGFENGALRGVETPLEKTNFPFPLKIVKGRG
jgi:hypothetical protein